MNKANHTYSVTHPPVRSPPLSPHSHVVLFVWKKTDPSSCQGWPQFILIRWYAGEFQSNKHLQGFKAPRLLASFCGLHLLLIFQYLGRRGSFMQQVTCTWRRKTKHDTLGRTVATFGRNLFLGESKSLSLEQGQFCFTFHKECLIMKERDGPKHTDAGLIPRLKRLNICPPMQQPTRVKHPNTKQG